MSKIQNLANLYQQQLQLEWSGTIAGAQRVMMIVYDKELERNLRAQRVEFEQRTRDAGRGWREVDFTHAFSEWLGRDPDREAFFEEPGDLRLTLEADFENHLVEQLRETLRDAAPNDVVAIFGVASLFGFVHISKLIRAVENDIKGRLVVFFPGSKQENNYRLLDARDGWNYLARSISLNGSGA